MGEEMDIRGLKAAVEIPPEPSYWPWLLAVLGLVALVAALWFFLKGRKGRRETVRVLSARDRAVAAVDGARELKEAGRSREFGYAVSDAVSAFFGGAVRVAVDAADDGGVFANGGRERVGAGALPGEVGGFSRAL